VQTVALAERSIVVAYGTHGFDAETLIVAIDALDLNQFAGFVYGSGFEAQPELLIQINSRLPLIGNSADTVAAVKSPFIFFATLQQLNINHPKVSNSFPEEHSNYNLIKFAGGNGGTHIRSAKSKALQLADNYYYQEKIDGRAVSLLFLANKHDIEVVGFNEQWLSPSVESPYRYGGAVCNAELPASIQKQLINAAKKLSNIFNLVGLNSVDAIVATENAPDDNGQVFVLEINPRLSATFDLYSYTEQNLFERHIQACLNQHCQSQDAANRFNQQFKAHAIVYASAEMELSDIVCWPDWVTDTPVFKEDVMIISSSEPVCSVFAYSDNADAAKKLAQSRVETIQNLLQLSIKKF